MIKSYQIHIEIVIAVTALELREGTEIWVHVVGATSPSAARSVGRGGQRPVARDVGAPTGEVIETSTGLNSSPLRMK